MVAPLTALPSIDTPRRRARILVVDDVPANLVATEAVLAPLGHDVMMVHSGAEALKALLHEEFAVILMDVQMPGLDGLETARLIRNRERTRHIPILFVTALSREAAYVTRGYAEGGVDYLLKPIDPDILRSKVNVFVELYLRGERLKEQALEIAARRHAEEELRRSDELGQQLMGIVGHDIRTPLSAILMTAQLQLESGRLDEAGTKAFSRVQRGGQRIARLVDGLLDFTRARIGGGIPIERRRGDLQQMVRNAVDEVQAGAPERRVECTLPAGELAGMWDLDRLSQVLANLLDNALKYGTAAGPVRVSLEATGETATLRVHNGGPAIPEAMMPQLFDPFRRADPADAQRHASLGLGLYIAREIVRAHGGSIGVTSTDAAGTTFEVQLPRGDHALPAPLPAAAHA